MEDKITKENKFVSAVVYLHNDAKFVDGFLDMIDKILSEGFTGYELIFVDDASTDDGVAKIRSYYNDKDKALGITSIIRLSHFQGQECAMNAGRDFAIGDFVYEFDDMLIDYDPSLIREIYKKALTGYDIVSAGCENAVSLSSKTFYGIYNKLSRAGEELSTESFRILSRRAINQVKSLDRYIPYRKAIYMNCGLNTTTVKYSAADPARRRAAIRARHDRSSLAVDSFIYFTDAMEKLAGFICITFAIIAIIVGIDIIYETAAFTRPVEGWRSIMGFLAIGFFGMFLVLAIIMRHLSVLIDLNFRRSRYLVSGIEKVTKE